MDILSHTLLGYASGKALTPRAVAERGEAGGAPFLAAWCTLWAILPDIDHVIEIFSEEAYLEWHRGPTHSFLVAIPAAAAAAWWLARRARRNAKRFPSPPAPSPQGRGGIDSGEVTYTAEEVSRRGAGGRVAAPNAERGIDPSEARGRQDPTPISTAGIDAGAAAGPPSASRLLAFSLLGFSSHVLTDILTPFGTRPLWPLGTERIALDWLPPLDGATLALLLVGVLLTQILTRNRRRAIRLLAGAFAGWLASHGLLHGIVARVHDPGAARPPFFRRDCEIRNWLVPWRYVGVAVSLSPPTPQDARVWPVEGGMYQIDEMNLFRVPSRGRRARNDSGYDERVRPSLVPSETLPDAIRGFRSPALLREAYPVALVDLQYLSIWPDLRRVAQESPFVWVDRAGGETFWTRWRTGRTPHGHFRGRPFPGHLVARGRPLAVALYGIALMFTSALAWGAWQNMRGAGDRVR